MIRTQVIGLTGPIGCGKDTVAELLCTHARFSALAFADVLRHQICEAFVVDMSLFTRRDLKDAPTRALALDNNLSLEFGGVMIGHLRKEHGDVGLFERLSEPRTPRQIMRWWANEYRRAQDPDYWTRALKSRVYIQQEGHQLRHVISDVRFPNEAAAIRAMGGKIWQIKRPGITADPEQPSETDGGEFAPDAVINNCHDIKHLQALVLSHWLQTEGVQIGWKELAGMGVVAVNHLAQEFAS